MIDKDMLLKLAQAACDAAVSNGAEFADVSAGFGKNLGVDLERSAIKSCDSRQGGGISVRAIYKGGTGWSSTNKLTAEAAAEAGKHAASLAKLAEPDPDFISLPALADSYVKVEGLSDPRIAEMEIKQLIECSLSNVDGALAVCSDAIVQGGFSAWYGCHALVNSLGVSLASDGSSIGGHIMAIVKRGEDVGSFYDFDVARVLDDFDPAEVGASAAREAMKFLGAKKIDTSRMPVILGPLASSSIFEGVVENADAEGIQRKRSFMMGKLGEKIGSDVLTFTDEPHIPRGMSSRGWDSEGFPTKPLVIMENGVLKSYLYGSYTAGKAGVPNTGHGTRGGGASASNVIPKLGTMTGEQIIRETKEGLYINMGGLSPNGTTGDVSGSVDFGFKIENGELAYPVMNTMVGGSFLEMLSNVDAVSSDYRAEPGMVMPTVRILDCLVAGGK
jgi:PmbA protein